MHRPRLVLLDEPTVGLDPQVRQELWALIDLLRSRGHEHPDVDALHRGGRAPLRQRDDHVARQRRRHRAAARPRAEHAGAEAVEVYGPPAKLAEVEREARAAGPEDPPHRHVASRVARRQRQRARGRAPPDQPRGRLRAADRRGDRVMATTQRLGRPRARPPLMGVLVREIINFSSFWRSSTFSATVEPTIYLLAFGFGFGSLVSRSPATTTSTSSAPAPSPPRCSSRAPSRHVRDVRQVQVPAHLRRDPRRAGRHRGAGHRRGAVDRDPRRHLRLCADARRDGLRARPELGDAARPVHRLHRRLRLGQLRHRRRRADELDRQLQLRDQRRADAAVPGGRHVLPDRRPARVGAGRWRSSTRSTTASSSSATRSSASRAGPTWSTSPSCSASAW